MSPARSHAPAPLRAKALPRSLLRIPVRYEARRLGAARTACRRPQDEERVTMGESTTAKVVADLVTEHIAPSLLTVEATDGASAPVLVLPKGLEAHSVKRLVDEHRSQPERRVGTARLGDLDSFVAHAVRFKGASSALFANPSPTSPSLTAVFDYHPMGAEGARFCQHRSVYAFPVSEEWQAWTALAGKPMSQEAFALLIENRIVDVADPAGVGETAKGFV